MESENNSGDSGGRSSYVPPRRLKERKRVTASATGNEKERHYSSQTDLAAGSSQLVGKKRCRDNEGLTKGSAEDEGDGPGNLQDSVIMSKATEHDIQQLRHRIDFFTHQVSGLLEAGKAYFLDASTAFEEGILQLHQKILETWEEEIEGLRNVDIVNEEICTHLRRLREAHDVLEKLQVSAFL